MKSIRKIEKSDVEDILALTPMQEGMLLNYLSNPESKVYFEQLSLKMSGDINVQILKRAWNYIVANNEVLRTLFRWENLDRPVQIVLKNYNPVFREYDLSDCSTYKKMTMLSEIKNQDIQEKIDINNEVFGVTLIKLNQSEYEMIISNHHISYDGWSNGILLRELIECYNSFYNEESPLKPIKSRYKEFVKWVQKSDKEKQKDFWGNYLKGLDTKTLLPIDEKNEKGTFEASVLNHKIDDTIATSLKEIVKVHEVTLASLLYCTWGILLQKYNNSKDVLFGTTISGRTADIKGIENMIGLFINTIPLRVGSEKNDTIALILKKINMDLIRREEFECTPLVDIKSYSELDNRDTIFDSIVIIENYPLDRVIENKNGVLNIDSYSMFEMTDFDLTLTITTFNGIELNFGYNKNKFELNTIQSFANQYSKLLKDIVSNPDAHLSEVDLMTQDEKSKLIVEFNSTKESYPETKVIHQLFEEQVERTPDNIALVFEGRQLTYRELNEKSNQIARALREQGIKSNDIVGLMVERSFEMIIALIGILKSGAAYLPVDPDYPSERIKYMLMDSNSKVLVTQSHLLVNTKFSGQIIKIEDSNLSQFENSNLNNYNSSKDLAYVIYTSGSTGNPKGVLIGHKAVHNFIVGMKKNIEFNDKKTILALTTICFDIFVLETIVPLVCGLKIVLAGERHQKDPNALSELVIKNNVDMLQMTPSRMQLLMANEKNLSCLKDVKEIMIGGESFPPVLLNSLKSCTKARIYNMYGPTETTVWSTMQDLTKGDQINVGKPIANTQIYIVGEENSLQPVGSIGELCISGDGLSEGYLNRPELTSQKFVQNLFAPGTIMYKTGDLAKWLPNGDVKILGRIDNQVKIRGFRIELSEIENQLLKYSGIKEAAVVSCDNQNNDKYLCAYIVGTKIIDELELRDYLQKELPTYMVPSYFVQIEKIPSTPNGKIDRRALPKPSDIINLDKEYIKPKGKIEEDIYNIWKKVLGTERISNNDNFFNIGGNSISLIQVHSQIEKLYPGKVTIPDLFAHTTISKLSAYIESCKERLLVKVPINSLILPREYFDVDIEGNGVGSFTFNLSGDYYEKLKSFSENTAVDLFDILLSVYAYLFAEITEQEEINFQAIMPDNEKGISITVNFASIDNHLELFSLVSDKKKSMDASEIYNIDDIIKMKIEKERNSIIPLFCNSASIINAKTNLMDVFDIILHVSEEEERMLFTFEYNGSKLNKDKVKELVSIYLKIVSAILKI